MALLQSGRSQYKVDVAKERILEINPDAIVNTYKTFYMPDTKEMFNFADYDYVVEPLILLQEKSRWCCRLRNAELP